MKKFAFSFVSSLLFAACSTNTQTPPQAAQTALQERSASPANKVSLFDTACFERQADSLVSAATNSRLHFQLNAVHLPGDGFSRLLFNDKDDSVMVYRYDAGKGKRIYNFTVRIGIYSSNESAQAALKQLRKASSTKTGLTYTNDYVLQADNNIIWLNTGCSYAYFNHIKLKKLLLQSIHYTAIRDSLVCMCGDDCR